MPHAPIEHWENIVKRPPLHPMSKASPRATQSEVSPSGTVERRWTRRALLASAPVLGLGWTTARLSGIAPEHATDPESPGSFFPRQDPETVLEVVTRAHFDPDGVRELVTSRPALARASWDWGFGDWESALGAASHMGRRDIAEVLIEHGARPNLFTFAMMGDLRVVRALVGAHPGIQGLRGPHGLTLLHHARAGGDAAQSVVDYLEEVGGADPPLPVEPLPHEEVGLYIGRYRFGPGEGDLLEVAESDGALRVARPPAAPRSLNALGNHTFFPVGAEAVRIRFEVEGERAQAVTVHDPGLLARGVRLP